MTTAIFKHIDTFSYTGKPWAKVDGPGKAFQQNDHSRPVHNIREGAEGEFTTDTSGFALYNSPATEKLFVDDEAVRGNYYDEVAELLKRTHKGVKKVYIFDHTIRRRQKDSPRQPVQQVHVDQTPDAAAARVKRHLPDEADELLSKRFQLINVWRPIENPASDYPLAVVDWRSTSPEDFVAVDLMYPTRPDSVMDDDDRGKEKLPDEAGYDSVEGYEIKGETMAVAPSDKQKFYYAKDMTPDEVLMLKCFDSFGDGMPQGKKGIAVRTPHTAFIDPNTPEDAPGRQSIEVRCLVFYE